MASRIDILLNNNDIVVSNNDIYLTESDSQHIIDTINAFAGWWKENFSHGVGIVSYYKGSGIEQKLSKAIKLNLKADGYDCSPKVSFNSSGKLVVDPNVKL